MNSTPNIYADEKLFRVMVDASPAGMIITDARGKIVLANQSALELFGYASDELLQESVELLIPAAYHEAHVSHRARYMSHPETRRMAAGRDLFAQRKDGTKFPVDVSLHPIEIEGKQLVLANILDATDRRRAEKEREQRQAMERLALLGQLAGGVAHEIRTPLCVIGNNVYFLQMFAEKLGPEGSECVQEIKEAVGKANRIVLELLDFTCDPQGELSEVCLADLVVSAVRDTSLSEAVSLSVPEIDRRLMLNVDYDQIERILINLLRNASQAMNEKGRIEIQIHTAAQNVTIEVVDEGPGIVPDLLERVFEPLFTTKLKGVGLGLAVSRRYAERNQGSLTAENRPDGGACFRLTLPVATSQDTSVEQ